MIIVLSLTAACLCGLAVWTPGAQAVTQQY